MQPAVRVEAGETRTRGIEVKGGGGGVCEPLPPPLPPPQEARQTVASTTVTKELQRRLCITSSCELRASKCRLKRIIRHFSYLGEEL